MTEAPREDGGGKIEGRRVLVWSERKSGGQ